MDDDRLTIPFFHRADLALQLMEHANAESDDDEVHNAVVQRASAVEALQKARRAHARAARVPTYPKEDLAVLKARQTRAEVALDTLSAKWRDAADRRLRQARNRRAAVLNDFLAKPPGVDAVVDRLDKAERLRKLEAIDPETRELMATTGAREGKYPELLRVLLSAEAPPWPVPGWQPLISDAAAEEVREWLYARKAPETVADIRSAWRLRRIAFDTEMDRLGYPKPGQPPGLDMISARPMRPSGS
jgi:hypothetical protein